MKDVLTKQFLAIVLLTIFVAAAVGFFVARSAGTDIEQVRSQAAELGARDGAERGSELGYRAGFRKAYKSASKKSFASAKRRTLKSNDEDSQAASVVRSCGDLVEEGAGTYSVKSENVVCDIARQVAFQWEACAELPCSVEAGFTCSTTQVASELSRTICVDGSRKVTFESGA